MTAGETQLQQRLTIGDATEICGLSARAIRFYEEQGLLVAHRDEFNRRWYDETGRRRLFWFARLRGHIPLARIAETAALEETEPGAGKALALRLLQAKRSAIEVEKAILDALIDLFSDATTSEICGSKKQPDQFTDARRWETQSVLRKSGHERTR